MLKLWSITGYECLGAYAVPGSKPLVDFDFDENKVSYRNWLHLLLESKPLVSVYPYFKPAGISVLMSIILYSVYEPENPKLINP